MPHSKVCSFLFLVAIALHGEAAVAGSFLDKWKSYGGDLKADPIEQPVPRPKVLDEGNKRDTIKPQIHIANQRK